MLVVGLLLIKYVAKYVSIYSYIFCSSIFAIPIISYYTVQKVSETKRKSYKNIVKVIDFILNYIKKDIKSTTTIM